MIDQQQQGLWRLTLSCRNRPTLLAEITAALTGLPLGL
jgi:hypothetical protein